MATTVLPPLPVAVPLLGAATLAALRSWLSRRVIDSLGILICAIHVAICVVLLREANAHTLVYWFGDWFPRGSMALGIGFVVDPTAAALALLAGVLFLFGFIFSWRFTDVGAKHYHSLMLVFLAAMSGFVLTADLFNLFVWFELMSTAAFALCGLNTSEPAPLQGTFNFAVTNTIAAFLGLTGIGLLYSVTGALNMGQIGLLLTNNPGGPRHDPLVLFAFTLLVCGFFVKAAIVPFHLWLPDAHAVAPTSVCVLFSGLMVELGLYAVARLHAVIFLQALGSHNSALRGIMLGFAVVTVLLGGIMCYAEHHLKRLLAFSTICHAGLMLAALAVQGTVASAAFLTYVIGHAFVKASLFFCAGIVLHRLRSLSEQFLWQRKRVLRWTGVLWFLGGLGLAGVPPFGTWMGEAIADSAAKQNGVHGIALLFIVGEALTAAAVFRVGFHVFAGHRLRSAYRSLGCGRRVAGDRRGAADRARVPVPDAAHCACARCGLVPAAEVHAVGDRRGGALCESTRILAHALHRPDRADATDTAARCGRDCHNGRAAQRCASRADRDADCTGYCAHERVSPEAAEIGSAGLLDGRPDVRAACVSERTPRRLCCLAHERGRDLWPAHMPSVAEVTPTVCVQSHASCTISVLTKSIESESEP